MIKSGQNVISIPRTSIRPFVGQPRESFSYDRLTELAASMRERGQLQPVIVRATGKSGAPWELVDGERRWRAAAIAGIDTMLAIEVEAGTSAEQYVNSVVANSAREDLTPVEQSRSVARIALMPGYDPRTRDGLAKLAAVFGRSPSWVASMLKLDGLAPEVKSLVEARKLPATAAVQLADVKSPARQAEIGQRLAAQPLRNNALTSALRNAVRVEHVREGREAKPVPGTHQRSTAAADAQLVSELVGRIAESAESLLDLPVTRLRAAYAGRPAELKAAVDRTKETIEGLRQVMQALLKLRESA